MECAESFSQAFEVGDFLPGGGVPHLENVANGGEAGAVGRKTDSIEGVHLARQSAETFAGGGAPQFQFRVESGGGDRAAIGRKGGVGDVGFMPFEHHRLSLAIQVPDFSAVVLHVSDDHEIAAWRKPHDFFLPITVWNGRGFLARRGVEKVDRGMLNYGERLSLRCETKLRNPLGAAIELPSQNLGLWVPEMDCAVGRRCGGQPPFIGERDACGSGQWKCVGRWNLCFGSVPKPADQVGRAMQNGNTQR